MSGGKREWAALAEVVSQIQGGLCLSCPTTRWKLRWNETGQRWQLVIVHRPRCQAVRSPVHRRRADEFIHGLLQLHGFGIAHYCEENLVVHTRLVIR